MYTFYTRIPIIGEVYGELAANGSWRDRWYVWEGSEIEVRIGRILIQNSRSRQDRRYARALVIAVCISAMIWTLSGTRGTHHDADYGNLPVHQGATNPPQG